MGKLGKVIYASISSKDKVEKYQQIIRDEEWKWLIKEIPANAKFLDVGCGAGYAMQKAKADKNCDCWGIDPDPGAHGVGRYIKEMVSEGNIKQGFAENLPFESKSFDLVFSSHVLEHVNDEQASLKEMKRVLKDDGILLIGMPTALMAWINVFSQIVFITHIRIYEFLRHIFTNERGYYFKKMFEFRSHSHPRANSILYDLNHYTVKNWKSIVSKEFEVVKVLEPALYPFPDFIQWFPLHKSPLGASSVFFVCKKKV